MPAFKDDEEIIDFIISAMFFVGNNYQKWDYYFVGTILQDNEVHILDAERIWRKLLYEDWITPTREDRNIYRLSDKGMELLRKYGSYSNFVKYIKTKEAKKESIEKGDRRVKNVGILITLGVSLLTLFLTQYNRWKDKQEQQKERSFQTIEVKIDSLLKALPPNRVDKSLLPTIDTATNK